MYTLILTLAIVLVFLAWSGLRYFRVRKAANYLNNADFEKMYHGGQLIDIREQAAYRQKHILGARNLPASQLKQSLTAIRKDKPLFIYDSSRSTSLPNAVLLLKKEGFTDINVLEEGFEAWTGKVK